MPGGEIGNADPGRNPSPEIGKPPSQEQGRVSTAGGADKVNSFVVDGSLFRGPLHRAGDVLDHHLGATGLGPAVGASKIRMDEGPSLLDAPLRVGNIVAVFVVTAPGMEADKERACLFCIG